MPRPKKPGAPEPKKRSRTGCWQCKGRKVKCGEERPSCVNCRKAGHACDYSIRLNWDGRRTKRTSYDGGAENALSSPTRGQRSFTIINQVFPVADSRPLVQQQPTTAESWRFSTNGDTGSPVDAHQDSLSPVNPTSPTSGSALTRWLDNAGKLQPSSPCTQHSQGASTSDDTSTNRPAFGSGRIHDPPDQPLQGPTPPEYFDSPTTLHQESESDRGQQSLDSAAANPPFRGISTTLPSPALVDETNPLLSLRFQPPANLAPLASPLTPATPSSYSDDDPRLPLPTQATLPTPPIADTRRVTVHSLLTGTPGPLRPIYSAGDGPYAANSPAARGSHADVGEQQSHFYGYDLGRVDLDVGRNNDGNAIAYASPLVLSTSRGKALELSMYGLKKEDASPQPYEPTRTGGVGGVGYYKDPVAIRIPYSLEPLPQRLLENPMNLLYFHHFLNHTARVLMPYDDQQSNPFRIILPQMAVKNDHLLSLLLAYSASHRARLLQQKEPEVRMAHWVADIFPTLRNFIKEGTQTVTNTILATAIMLASLEIISPTAFGFTIPWHKHLGIARDLMRMRFPDGGWGRTHVDSRGDQECSFLWSWFAYLDVLGSLSGRPTMRDGEDDPPFVLPLEYTNDPDEIDCVMGFTTRCVRLLARTAELARESDAQRIIEHLRPTATNGAAPTSSPVLRSVDPTWRPSRCIEKSAYDLEEELLKSVRRRPHPCKHILPGGVNGRDAAEMEATNEAFHWAGVVHLHRRALGKPASHAHVRTAVERIVACLSRIRPNGTAEMGVLFPVFTAGCEAEREDHRAVMLERFGNMERNGMTQIRKARELMERVWRERKPWELLINNEFIG